jgi:hypothetical protein
MARRLEIKELPPEQRGGGRGSNVSLYDWDIWFDGAVWELKMGVDFVCSLAQMRAAAHAAASRRGMKIETRTVDDALLIRRSP